MCLAVQLGQRGDFERALELFLAMQMGNMEPTRGVLLAMLSACAATSHPRAARQLVEVPLRRLRSAFPSPA